MGGPGGSSADHDGQLSRALIYRDHQKLARGSTIEEFFGSTSAKPFFRPDHVTIALPCRTAVKDGRRLAATRRACP